LPKERIAIKLPEEKLKEYEGEYEITKDLHVIISLKMANLSQRQRAKERITFMQKKKIFYLQNQRIYN
jgi:hypothetical protein